MNQNETQKLDKEIESAARLLNSLVDNFDSIAGALNDADLPTISKRAEELRVTRQEEIGEATG